MILLKVKYVNDPNLNQTGVLYTVFVITFVLSIIMNNCIVFTQRFEWLNMINIIKY